MRSLVAAVLLLAAASPQEPDKLEAALKKFGARTYVMSLTSGEKIGTRTLKTSVVTEEGRKIAVFEESTEENGKLGGTTVEKAELNGLKLVSMRITIMSGGKPDVNTITVEGGKAALKFTGDEDKKVDVTDKTVGDEALLRLVCAAEQKEGAELKLDVLSWPLRDIEAGRVLKCEGKKPVEIGGKKLDAFLWTEPGHVAGGYKYWVSPGGFLLRWIGLGGVSNVLISK
jgi:hypothetical protein